MGVIQNAVNQMIGTATIAARLSPGLEEKAKTRSELRNLGKQEQALAQQQEILRKSVEPDEYEAGRTVGAQALKKSYEKEAEIKARKFELKPSKETAKESLFAASGAGKGPLMTFPADPEEIFMEQQAIKEAQELELAKQQELAMQEVAKQQEAKQKQKRNFLSYLKEQETSFGGKVGDLPMSMQKAIAKQYSKGERVNLMNQADKEKMNKDGNK